MRPTRIQLEGFMAYREPTEVDFDGVDFFSLSGPTGSGKSSLIDAMIFALYGRVPRLDAKSVAPILSSGGERARVSLDFEVGEDTYTAVRSVKRTKGGASTDEARLQKGEEVISSGAGSVTSAAEDLLSLGFEDFTRTVVLPQGDFAEFLEATPGERQRLLRKLLEYDFTAVRNLATTRAAVAEDRASAARAKLDSLDLVDDAEMKRLNDRLKDLDRLAKDVVEREQELTQQLETAKAHKTEVARVDDAVKRLSDIRAPDNLENLESAVGKATEDQESAQKAVESSANDLEAAKKSMDALPTSAELESLRSTHKLAEEAQTTLASLREEDVISAKQDADDELVSAEADLATAQQELDGLRTVHAAHTIGQHLTPGDECPVCGNTVSQLSAGESPDGLEELERRRDLASKAVEESRRSRSRVGEQVAAIAAKREQITKTMAQLEEELKGKPGRDEIDDLATKLLAAELLVKDRTSLHGEAVKALKSATSGLEDASEAVASLTRSLMASRETVADLEPPLPSADDPLVQWKELVSWADQTLIGESAALEDVTKLASQSELAVTELDQSLRSHLRGLSIEPVEPYSVAVATTLEKTRAAVEQHQRQADEAKVLKQTTEDSSAEAEVARGLAAHLKSNGFEQWLMQGALADLVDGANSLLVDLSANGYSLSDEDDGTFQVVDHRNAGEKRPVATLSGGETFLVSLALALALAETLAGSRGAGLDAIFLDEGFGSLDEESLEVVASVLEDLTSRGLMVGVISHVRDLAARAPVRFEVTRSANGSSVRRAS